MRIFIGNTYDAWFYYLRSINPDEVNFWQPKSTKNFQRISEGELFLFKLHHPNNFVVGGGFFVRQALLPMSLTWQAFGVKNGANSEDEFIEAIYKCRKSSRLIDPDPIIGSLIIAQPFFFNEYDWIPIPKSWSSNIVQGKTYSTETEEGLDLYNLVVRSLGNYTYEGVQSPRYGTPQIISPRLGQGSFRIAVTEAYQRRCAITGERTLPVLDASHIKPYKDDGPNTINNGLLLRQDIHTLFDQGYITINAEDIVEVSSRIKTDYGNGKEYYAFHGKKVLNLPQRIIDRPSMEYLNWHNENIYIG